MPSCPLPSFPRCFVWKKREGRPMTTAQMGYGGEIGALSEACRRVTRTRRRQACAVVVHVQEERGKRRKRASSRSPLLSLVDGARRPQVMAQISALGTTYYTIQLCSPRVTIRRKCAVAFRHSTSSTFSGIMVQGRYGKRELRHGTGTGARPRRY